MSFETIFGNSEIMFDFFFEIRSENIFEIVLKRCCTWTTELLREKIGILSSKSPLEITHSVALDWIKFWNVFGNYFRKFRSSFRNYFRNEFLNSIKKSFRKQFRKPCRNSRIFSMGISKIISKIISDLKRCSKITSKIISKLISGSKLISKLFSLTGKQSCQGAAERLDVIRPVDSRIRQVDLALVR